MPFSEDQLRAYADLLGFEGSEIFALPLTKETLDTLTFRHQCRVPFQTLSIHRSGKAPTLAIDELYDKIVVRKLGGFCFELNRLYEELLRTLGFDVRPVLCRAVRGPAERMPINHRAILATIEEGVCFVDVGYGGPVPAGALLLVDGLEQKVRVELYTPRRYDDSWWGVERLTRAKRDFYDNEAPVRRQIELDICLAAVEDIDFLALNLSCTQPGTLFRDHDLANVRTENGYRGYLDGTLTVLEGSEKTVTEMSDAAQEAEVLSSLFGIDVSIVARQA